MIGRTGWAGSVLNQEPASRSGLLPSVVREGISCIARREKPGCIRYIGYPTPGFVERWSKRLHEFAWIGFDPRGIGFGDPEAIWKVESFHG